MRIAFIAAGSGPRFYCENCARDGSLARALGARGHHVETASLYLPISGENGRDAPLFCGAIGLYLRHQVPLVRRAPRWAQRILDARPLLSIAGRLSGATTPRALQDLTLSMLRGDAFTSAADAEALPRWLESVRPDVIHLSNALLIGLAEPLRKAIGVPVTCTLQDEDTWIDAMDREAREEAWRIMTRHAASVDLFLPVSSAFGKAMAVRMGLSSDRYRVVPIGIDVDGEPRPKPVDGPAVIGYLSRIALDMGAELLADAVLLLAGEGRFPDLRLHMTGGATAADAPVLRSLRRRFAAAGLSDRLFIEPAFDPLSRRRFLEGVTVLSVPVPRGEAFGLFMLEAMAAGVPVVQPRLGGFTELVEDTGGGILYEPNTASALAQALSSILADRGRTRDMGLAGRQAVVTRYSSAAMAEAMESAFAHAAGKLP
jgi:glycosyltransferase involved in cell wall biosynthesis